MPILTPNFRVSYPHVFKPQINKLSGKSEYSLVALYPRGADLSVLKKEVEDLLIKKWGADKKKWPQKFKTPFRDQGEKKKVGDDGKEYYPDGYEEGGIFMNLKSKDRPGLVNQKRETIIDESEFYAGCWARATINAYYYDQAGNKGVAFGLNNIQKVKDDDPITGKTTAEEDFSAITDAPSSNTNSLFT